MAAVVSAVFGAGKIPAGQACLPQAGTGLAACALPLIRLLLREQWLPSVPYLQIFCFVYAFFCVHTANLNAIKALGRSDLFLKLEIIKKAMGLVVLFSTIWFGPLVMAYSMLLNSVLMQIINSWPNKKLLGYSYLDQLKDMLPQMGLSVVMGVIVYCIHFLHLNDIVTLIIQVPLGIAIYLLGSKILHIESFHEMIDLAKKFIPKKKTQEGNA